MKTLLTILTVFFTVMFSPPSYAEWTKVAEYEVGTNYVDFDRIRKVDGYVYYWVLTNLSKPLMRVFSNAMYWQGDCRVWRIKPLTMNLYNKPMGGGTSTSRTLENPKWKYPTPNSAGDTELKAVCDR